MAASRRSGAGSALRLGHDRLQRRPGVHRGREARDRGRLDDHLLQLLGREASLERRTQVHGELRGAAGRDERRDRRDLAFAQREAGSRVDLAVRHLHDQPPEVAERLDRGERSFAVDLAELVSAAFEPVGVGHSLSSSVRLAPFGWSVRADGTVRRRSALRGGPRAVRQPAAGGPGGFGVRPSSLRTRASVVARSPGLSPIQTRTMPYASVPAEIDSVRSISHLGPTRTECTAHMTAPPARAGGINRRNHRSNGQMSTNRFTSRSRANADRVSVTASAIAAPFMPYVGASQTAIPTATANEAT